MIDKEDLRDYPEIYDIDWYLVSKERYLIHFSSSGGQIPKLVLDNYECLYHLRVYFDKLPEITTGILNPLLNESRNFLSKNDYKNYVKYYMQLTCKGFYTFDKTIDNVPINTEYHLVSYPQKPIQIDLLPDDIKEILLKFQLGISINGVHSINLSDFSLLW